MKAYATTVIALLVLIVASSSLPSSPAAPRVFTQPPEINALPEAKTTLFRGSNEIAFDLPAVDLPANLTHEGMHQHNEMEAVNPGYPPVTKAIMPRSGAIYAFRVEMLDSAGNQLPSQLLHHLNFIDPFRRELFLPISRRLIAAGKETGSQKLPWLLFGVPIQEGQVLVLSAMLHNPTGTAYRQVRTRLVLSYTPSSRPWPFFDVFPWQLDVLFPVGDKSFDLPPGRSSKSYEARPALDGKIVAVGGHVHEHATRISLTDVTTGAVLWEAAPETDAKGQVTSVPVGRLYSFGSVGAAVRADHVYRVTVEYTNPTDSLLPEGGMGVIGGLFSPDESSRWPEAGRSDTLYLADMQHYLRAWSGHTPPTGTAKPKPAAPAHHH
jgi:hypothetical protein